MPEAASGHHKRLAGTQFQILGGEYREHSDQKSLTLKQIPICQGLGCCHCGAELGGQTADMRTSRAHWWA